MFCGNCGKELEENYKFCPGCGNSIDCSNIGTTIAVNENQKCVQTDFSSKISNKRVRSKTLISIFCVVIILFFLVTFLGGSANKIYRYIQKGDYNSACQLYEAESKDKIIQKIYLNIYLKNYSDNILALFSSEQISYYHADKILSIMDEAGIRRAEKFKNELETLRTNITNKEEANKELYIDFIDNRMYKNDLYDKDIGIKRYSFLDFNQDGTLELLLSGYDGKNLTVDEDGVFNNILYTIDESEGEIILVHKFESLRAPFYAPSGNLLYYTTSRSDPNGYYYRMDNSSMVLKLKARRIEDDTDTNFEDDRYEITEYNDKGNILYTEIIDKAEKTSEYKITHFDWRDV